MSNEKKENKKVAKKLPPLAGDKYRILIIRYRMVRKTI